MDDSRIPAFDLECGEGYVLDVVQFVHCAVEQLFHGEKRFMDGELRDESGDEDESWDDGRDEEEDDEDLSAEDSAILAEAVAAELETEPQEQRDDLKMIKGVGPAIEKTLNEMGIFNFQQIADMSEYDIDRVARRLKGFHSRIQREDWIGQARMLLDQAAHA